jgi:hypothetical protein
MWAFFLTNYNKIALIFLGVLVVFKILLTVVFIKNYERTVIGIVSYIFRWNSIVQRDMAESSTERFVMGLQNFVSVFIYTIATILTFIKLLT